MTTSQLERFWALLTLLLVAIIVIGGILAWVRYSPGQPLEISLPLTPEPVGRVYLAGAVANPGFYPWQSGDSIQALFQAAGGTTSSANLSGVKLYIPAVGEGQETQRVDLNRAEVWLLMALPDIGKTLAQRIVDYRQKNGPFRSTNDLLKVSGIGPKTYEQIKALITIGD